MTWSVDIATLLESGQPIERSYELEVRNGYQASVADPWSVVPIGLDGWEAKFFDNNPVVSSARFTIPSEDFVYHSEMDPTNSVQTGAACRLKMTIRPPGLPAESEYIFRGIMNTPQITDFGIVVEAFDILSVMEKKRAPGGPWEAVKDGPHADVSLDHADNWDPVGEYTFEIERIAPNDWAFVDEDEVDGGRRVWVPGAYHLQKDDGMGGWLDVAASEYLVDTALGLIRFSEDMTGESFQLLFVTVYLEGTLEIADIMTDVLELGPLPYLFGCGFPTTMTRVGLTGTATFVQGSASVVGAGTLFTSELRPGDRIATLADPGEWGVVLEVTDDLNLVLMFDYPGTSSVGSVVFFLSTLRYSGVNVSNVNWSLCQGSAAELYRRLQDNYTDSKGYKIWYDHENDLIRGDQAVISFENAVSLPPKVSLQVTSTNQDFATAVLTTGTIGVPKNLATAVATSLTELLGTNLGPAWDVGPTIPGVPPPLKFPNVPGGLVYGVSVDLVRDQDMYSAYANYHNFMNIPDALAATLDYFDYCEFDFGAPYDLSKIVMTNINGKNADKKQGVTILGSTDGVNYVPISVNTIEVELALDETKDINVEGTAAVQYVRFQCRPFFWEVSGTEVTMGFREIIIYGSQKICEGVFVQDAVPPDGVHLSGNITFQPGGPPWLVTGQATTFIADLDHGYFIAADTDFSTWAEVDVVIDDTHLWLIDRYEGIPGTHGLLYMALFVEGNGGHFIGGTGKHKDFVVDYYPNLMKKFFNTGYLVREDSTELVYTPMQAKDRCYLVLNESIRLYREVAWTGAMEVRVHVFDTVTTIDDYRSPSVGPEELFFMAQSILMTDKGCAISGTEYGAGVLR